VHTWIGELQSSAHNRSWLRGSWSEEADGAGSRRRTEVPRGKRMRSPGGYETHRDAPAGVDAQRRRRQATGSLSLLSLPAVLRRVSLRALALFLSLLLFLSAPTAEGRESLSRAAFLPAQNPSRARLSFPRRHLCSRAGPASAPARSRLTTKASART